MKNACHIDLGRIRRDNDVFASLIFITSCDNDGGATTKVAGASGGSGVGTATADDDGTFPSLSTIECTPPLRDIIGTEDNGNDGNVDGSYLVPPKGRRRRPKLLLLLLLLLFQAAGNSTGEIGFGEISLFVVVSASVVLSTLVLVVVRHARCMMGD